MKVIQSQKTKTKPRNVINFFRKMDKEGKEQQPFRSGKYLFKWKGEQAHT